MVLQRGGAQNQNDSGGIRNRIADTAAVLRYYSVTVTSTSGVMVIL